MLQLLIATTLFFVLIFGIGFIINMLVKSTWVPVYLYIALVIGLIYFGWEEGPFTDHLFSYTIVDLTPAVGGLIGAILSGWTIRYLRKSGYRMF